MKNMNAPRIYDIRDPEAKNPWGKVAMIRSVILAVVLVALVAVAALARLLPLDATHEQMLPRERELCT